MVSVTWGCNQDSSGNKQNSKKEVQQQTQPPVKLETPSGVPDQHGRKPGDQHYGHSHAPGEHQPAGQTNTQPAAGQPDSRGRKPGDQHYGHDHD